MPRAAADFRELLTILRAHDVEFIVVGGVAAVIQGAPLTTFDLDIVPSLAPANVLALSHALTDLDASYRERPELRPDPAALASRGHKLLMTRVGPLDVLGAIGNDDGFDELAGDTITLEAWDLSIVVLGLERLIRIKELVGRDKDLAALPILASTLAEQSGDD